MGKIAFNELHEIIKCIKKGEDVLVPPMPGYDSGVHKIGNNQCIVIATDPCIGVPEEYFGWLLINYSASDVALFGAKPKYCTINLLGPPSTKLNVFKKIMEQSCKATSEIGMKIITGHTGTYNGITSLVATCTSYGIVNQESLITPDGAKAGDLILMTKFLGLETLVNFVLGHKHIAEKMFGNKKVIALEKGVIKQTCVDEALLLAKVGVSAMHDATEGGLIAALNEMADTSETGFYVEYDTIPIIKEVETLAEKFSLTNKQILSMSSTGSILVSASPDTKKDIMDKFSKQGFDVIVIGKFLDSKRRILINKEKEEMFPREIDDPYAKIMNNKK